MFKDNPVLTGKESEDFHQRMKDAKAGVGRVPKEEYEKSKKIYDSIREKQLKELLQKWFDEMTEEELRHFINEFTNINI